MRSRRSIVALVACAGAFAAASASPGEALPGVECVRLVRSARIAEQAGDTATAAELLTAATDRCPDEVAPIQELLRLYRKHGISPERTSELERRLVARLEDPERPLAAGSLLFLIHRADDDEEVLESLLAGVRMRTSEADAERELLEARVQLERRLGRPVEARETLGRLLEREASPALVAEALRLDLELEDWESALRLTAQWVDDPSFGFAVRPLHLELLARTGETARVVAEMEQLGEDGIGLSSFGYESLLKRIAWAFYDTGDVDAAEAIWRGILEEDPEDLEARRVVANLFSGGAERLAHREEVDRQLDGEESPQRLLDEGTRYLSVGDNERAFALLSRAAPALVDEEAAWFNLGLAALALERYRAAADAFAHAARLNPGRAETHFQRATALREQGLCAAAIGEMETALELEPDRGSVYYYLARCYREIGDEGRAAAAMEEYERRREP